MVNSRLVVGVLEVDLGIGLELVVVVAYEVLVVLEQEEEPVEFLEQVEQTLKLGVPLLLQIQVAKLLLFELNGAEDNVALLCAHQDAVEPQQHDAEYA